MDVDFRADKINNDVNVIREAVEDICKIACPEDGVVFDEKNITGETITEFKDYHGIRIHLSKVTINSSKYFNGFWFWR